MWPFNTVTDPNRRRNRSAGRQRCEVFLQPIELFLAKDSQTAFADVYDVDQPNEVDTPLVETIPTGAEGFLSKSLSIHRPVIAEHVVLTRHVENLACLDLLQVLFERIELFRL